jgi:hypothetical protein
VKRPIPPPTEQPWAAWKSTEADTESTALRLTVQIVKAATQILPGGSLHAGKTAYTDMAHFGFWLGVDPTDKQPKINIGGPDWYLKFTGRAWDISLYSGLQDGGHVGMRYSDTDEVDRWTLEAVDSSNVPFFSAETGLTDAETALTIGYADHAKIALVGQEIVVDAAALPDLSATYSPAAHTHALGATDHGALTGLADDDHGQYHTDARGDARYSVLAHAHAGNSGYQPLTDGDSNLIFANGDIVVA